MSADFQEMVITYKGLVSNVTGITCPYVSLTGSTYAIGADGTPAYMTVSGTGLTGRTFSSGNGTVNAINWRVKEDEGTSFYNNTITLSFSLGATGIGVTGIPSTTGTTTVNFSRTQAASASTASQTAFPSDYSGQSGSDLKRNAPKV